MPNCLNYSQNFLFMLDKLNEPDYAPDPRLYKLLDKLFILLAGTLYYNVNFYFSIRLLREIKIEHGSNCSTVTMRHLASSGVDPYTALSGASGALFGERKR
jgi:citrate synthase